MRDARTHACKESTTPYLGTGGRARRDRGWPQPACTFDAYVEFRHLTNDGSAKGREKGFYSLPGALQYFGENGIDTAHKTDMRGRIVSRPAIQRRRARSNPEILRG